MRLIVRVQNSRIAESRINHSKSISLGNSRNFCKFRYCVGCWWLNTEREVNPMTDREQLDQGLLEFIYDLLPDNEAAALSSQITSDPDVARAYAEVRQQADVLAAAAKIEGPLVQLRRPAEQNTAPAGGREPPSGRAESMQTTAAPWVSPWARAANWFVGLAATLLIGTVCYVYVRSDSPINPRAVASAESELAERHLRLVVTGPGRLQADTTNYFTVATSAANGAPLSAEVEYVVYSPAGKPLLEEEAQTDEEGRLQITLPRELGLVTNSRLEVLAFRDADNSHRTRTPLEVEPIRYATQLSLDKPLYRPGETVYYRSLTLSRFGMVADREMPIHFEILDPAGGIVPESALEGVTEQGVGSGAFDVPPHLPGGTYTLVVRSLHDTFPEERREFSIRQYRTPRLKKELEFARDSYAPGDTVVADFSAKRAEGGPVADAGLRILVTVDEQQVPVENPTPKTTSAGTCQVRFQLPEQIDKGAGTLVVVVDDGGTRETIAKTIPINLGKVEVQFYPEGGDLVAGLENRVYFHGYDPLGEPVHLQGRVVDGSGSEVAQVETTHEGRGAFRFTPEANETYTLQITSPAGVTSEPTLPLTNDERWLVMATGNGVFGPAEPVALDVLSTKANAPLVVSAVCRGAQVGQREFVVKDVQPRASSDRRRANVTLPLVPEAAGVIRLTVYDYSTPNPQPVAERLVYRRPSQKLHVAVADHSEGYSPGQPVQLGLIVTDETGQPVPATLGVTVVDDALLSLADDRSPRMPTHFMLATEIEKPEDLEDANFYLSDEEGAATALDLLLGTQGWRRFVELTLEELGQLATADAQMDTPADSPQTEELAQRREALDRLVALQGEVRPPVTRDNVRDAQSDYKAALAALAEQRVKIIQYFGRWLLLGGLAVLVVLTLMALLRLAGNARVWVPALGAAAACGAIGVIWLGASADSEGQIAFATLPSFAPAETQVAEADLGAKSESPWGDDATEDDVAKSPDDDPFEELEEGEGGDGEGQGGQDPDALGIEPGGDAQGQQQGGGPELQPGEEAGQEGIDMKKRLEEVADEAEEPVAYFDGFRDLADLEFDEADGRFYVQDIRQLNQLLVKLQAADGKQVAVLEDLLEASYERFRFTVRTYAHAHTPGPPGVRTDFAETLFWNPLLVADENGRATIHFDLSDSVTTFRLAADAHGDGRIGTGQGEIISRIPFSLQPKLPLEVNAGDRIELPLAVNNDTREALPVAISFEGSELLKLSGDADRQLDLSAGVRHREYFTLDVVGQKGEANVQFRGLAGNLSDGIGKSIRVVPPGFPVSDSYAGQLTEDQTLVIPLPEGWVDGSLEVTLQAFPSSLADLQKGLDSILREPYGCFEQTSTSNYPNVLALSYMQEHDVADPEFTRRAKDLLKKGYARLTSFESPNKGYEWFGGDPGHEALTAYGLLEFRDMSAVWDVDEEMVARTSKWLMDRRDGNGGFQRNARALDTFGRAPQDITDAYIVWALTEAEQQGIDKEVERVIALARESEDPYLVALAAASAINAGHKDAGSELLDRLVKYQKEDGHLQAVNGTITRSGGLSLQMETTALAAMAWLKTPRTAAHANKAVEWISSNRQGSGGFGSTQATILALKALIQHAKASRKTVSSGALFVKRDDGEIGRSEFTAGENRTIVVEGLAAQLTPGENELTIGLTGDNQMPYVLDVNYRTHKPVSDQRCPVRLSTRLAAEKVNAGDTVGLTVALSNESGAGNEPGTGQPMTVAIVGLPAGLEARVDQLDELKDAGEFDYYEMTARELIFYWRSLSPDAKDDKKIKLHLDLVAEIPGQYTAPASRTYLYYTAEQKHWIDPLQIEIAKGP